MQPHPGATTPEPFAYGYRFETRDTGEGPKVVQVPLTLQDVLHPQEGDVILETKVHLTDRTYLLTVCDSRRDRLPAVAVVNSDQGTDFALQGVRPISPDVAVFHGLSREPDPAAGLFFPDEFEAKCLFVVEIVSPSTRSNDVTAKLEIYHRAGVPLYILIDQKGEGDPRTLVAHQWRPNGYVPAPRDAEGRLPIPELGLLLAVRNGRAVFFDEETGAEVGDYSNLSRQIAELQERDLEREDAIASFVVELREANRAREAAEKKLAAEAAAREAAEKKLAAEAAAREAAEKSQATAAAAREAAEKKLATEAAAREAAEKNQATADAAREAAEKKLATEAAARAALELEVQRMREELARFKGAS